MGCEPFRPDGIPLDERDATPCYRFSRWILSASGMHVEGLAPTRCHAPSRPRPPRPRALVCECGHAAAAPRRRSQVGGAMHRLRRGQIPRGVDHRGARCCFDRLVVSARSCLFGSARGYGSVLALALGAASPALAAIDLVGAANATFVWQPASGPVSGYVVYQVCEATGQTQKSSVATTQVTLSPQPCSAFSVQVAAYGVDGLAQTGPLSEPSELVRFLPAAPPPPPDPAPGGEPTPPAGNPVLPPGPRVDFDADGRSDVLLHHPRDGALQLWTLRSRDAQFVLSASPPAFPPAARVVGCGDYDGDGFADLLGLDRGQVFVWLMHEATPIGGGLLGDDLGDGWQRRGFGRLRRRRRLGRADPPSGAGPGRRVVDGRGRDRRHRYARGGSRRRLAHHRLGRP